MKAMGVIEVLGFSTGILTMEAMLKTSDIEVITWEKKLGGRLVSIVIEGDVSAVKAAMDHGEMIARKQKKTVVTSIINRPHPEVEKLVEKSKRRNEL